MLSKKDKDTARLGTQRIGGLLFEFALPAIIASLFNSLYNVIDTAILGWYVGEVGVAVTTLALPIMTILMACSVIAGIGGNALAAIQLGQGKLKSVEQTLGNTTVLLVIFALVIAVASIVFINPILTVIGTTAELWEPTKAFVQIICVMFVFWSLGMGLNNFLRTAGKPVLSLVATVIGTIACIIFNILFVAVLGMGVAGSAWATIAGQFCGMVPVIYYFAFSKKAAFRLKPMYFRLVGSLVKQILALGLASFAMQIASTAVSIVFNQVATIYGAQDALGAAGALAAIGIAQKACWFVFAFFMGITMGMQPIVGFNFGAQKWDRVIKTLKLSCIWGAIFGTIFLVLSHVFPTEIVQIFGITGELESFAVMALQIYTIFMPLVGFQVVAGSYFQSSGQPVKAAIIELLRQVIFLIPLYLILPHVAWLLHTTPLMAILIATPLSDILSVLVTTFLITKEVIKLCKWRKEAAGNPDTSLQDNS